MPKNKRPALAYAEERFARAEEAERGKEAEQRLDPFRVVTIQVMGEDDGTGNEAATDPSREGRRASQ